MSSLRTRRSKIRDLLYCKALKSPNRIQYPVSTIVRLRISWSNGSQLLSFTEPS